MINLDTEHDNTPPARSPKAQQIIDAASKLFLSNGFGSVSMDAIAKQANVSKPTLYSHFQDKEALFSEIMCAMCENAGGMELLETLQEEERAPEFVLKELGKTKLDLVISQHGLSLVRIVFAETPRFPSLGQTFWETGPKTYYVAFEAYMRKLDAQGVLHVPDPAKATMNFDGMITWNFIFPLLSGVISSPSQQEINDHVDSVVADFLKIHAV